MPVATSINAITVPKNKMREFPHNWRKLLKFPLFGPCRIPIPFLHPCKILFSFLRIFGLVVGQFPVEGGEIDLQGFRCLFLITASR